MTNEEWATSKSAPAMLEALYLNDPDYFETLRPNLHRYLIACCWKIEYLIPQKHLQIGLRGAEKWIEGEITDEQLSRLDWYAEAEAFAFENVNTFERINEIKSLIESIDELAVMTFGQAKEILKSAAYFAESAMIYPKILGPAYCKKIFQSQFLCPDLLREHIHPNFK